MVTCTSLPDGAPPATNFRPRFHWWGREARQDAHQVTKDYGTQSRGLL